MKNLILVFSLMNFLLIGQAIQAQTTSPLQEKEKKEIQYLLEEEKMARDVYLKLNEKWNSTTFAHISSAEQRHLTKMKTLATQNSLTIPNSVLNDERGKFENVEIQKLYDELIAMGTSSLTNALRVGAKIEEKDIQDLRIAIKNTENKSILNVYQKLEQASKKHLQSFTNNLKKEGVVYEPIILTQKDYEAIVNVKDACTGKAGKGKACCSAKKGKEENASCCANKKAKGKKGKACCKSKN